MIGNAKEILAVIVCIQVLSSGGFAQAQQGNLALGKFAYQSSLLETIGVASNAVDGNKNHFYVGNSCSHTNLGPNPWWVVDLGGIYSVGKVVITNRGDCCGERLNDLYIGVGAVFNRNGGLNQSEFNTCVQDHGSKETGETLTLYCQNYMEGQYVAITSNSTMLTLCEVEVYPGLGNLAVNKLAYQSSTYELMGVASHAVDGNKMNMYIGGSCTHTDVAADPWWVVDLGGTYSVGKVIITNRADHGGFRLKDVLVGVGKSFDKDVGLKKNEFATCVHAQGTGWNGQTLVLHCRNHDEGRYVSITTATNILTLCEVEVYGTYVYKEHTQCPL